MAEYPAHLKEMGWSPDGRVSSSSEGNGMVPRWPSIQLIWRKWAHPKMAEYLYTWRKWAGAKMAEYDTNLNSRGSVSNQPEDKVVARLKMAEYYLNLKKIVVASSKMVA
jgi:hypothetical protein